ncbi:hypothetical protein ACGRHY_27465 [Streptomyces sp. HK10]|uniref:hypothetical protein n=1 Tax=Streptomyces sp. HK10 TaxID=3373255 RepID=UPI00374973B9
MLVKYVMPHVRRIAAITTTIRTAMTRWFDRRASPSTELPPHRELHQATRFWPAEAAGYDGEDTLPALEERGVLVFIYFDSDASELQFSIDLDTVDPRLARHDGTVPMHITVQGDTVFRA